MLKRFVLHITRNCNLDCSYCYERDKTSGNVPLKELMANIDLIFKDTCSNDTVQIEFLGGEPLLATNLIEFATDYIKTNYSNTVEYLLTTNGTIFSPKIVELLNKNKIKVFISIDGTRFMHDLCRVYKHTCKGSYDQVMLNAQKYLNSLLIKPSVQFTLHKYNIAYLYEGIKNLYSHGFKSINLGVVHSQAAHEPDFYHHYLKQHQLILNDLENIPGLYLTPLMSKDIKVANKHISVVKKNGSTFLEAYVPMSDDELCEDNDYLKLYRNTVADCQLLYRGRKTCKNYVLQ